MADEDDDQEQDETPEPPQRLFTLTEAERARQELEPFLVEAMDSRKKLSGLENELAAVSARIMMMGGIIVPYEKLAAVRMEHQQLAETLRQRSIAFSKPVAWSRISTSASLIFPPSSTIRTSTSAGSSAKTASVFIIARTKDSLTANRSTRATSAPATPSSSFGFACLCKGRTLVRPHFSCCHPERSEGPQLPVSRFFKL